MSEAPDNRGEAQVQRLQRDLLCPQCDYNLRGLSGACIHCPECGLHVDVARLITQRWTGPWYKAPGLQTLSMPVVWLTLGPVALIAVTCMFSGVIHSVGNQPQITNVRMVAAALGLVWLGVWVALMYRSWGVFQAWKGVWLALVEHALLAGYLAGIAATITGLIYGVVAGSRGNWAWAVALMPFVAAALAWLYGCRRLERWVAEQCVREYLRRRAGM